jgi:hypothetical protein
LPKISQSAHIKRIIHRLESGPATTWLSERCLAPCFSAAALSFSRGGYHHLGRCAFTSRRTVVQRSRVSRTGICLRDLSAVQSRDARREHSR